MLARLGIDPGRDEPKEVPHNHRLTPRVWLVRTGDNRPAVLKYLRANREPGETAGMPIGPRRTRIHNDGTTGPGNRWPTNTT